MNMTIIGASAGVGLECAKRAVQRNHIVTTLSRSDISLESTKSLIVVKGSATNKEDLKRSISTADAVIVALGTGKNMKATTLYSDFAKLLVQVQQETQTRIPFIVSTGFGGGDSGAYNSLVVKLFFKIFLKDVYADKTKMEEIILHSYLKWEIVRPDLLKDKPLTGNYRIETKLYKNMHIGNINRADVADFLVKEAENQPNYTNMCHSQINNHQLARYLNCGNASIHENNYYELIGEGHYRNKKANPKRLALSSQSTLIN